VFGCHPEYPQWLDDWLGLLFDRPAATRPDGFLVTDDHLAAPLAASLQRLGHRPGPDTPVVSHCNYPCLPAGVTEGVTWLGFDLQELLEEAVMEIDRQKTGTPPGRKLIGAKFLPEYEAASRSRAEETA
jgi:hypothetical protein